MSLKTVLIGKRVVEGHLKKWNYYVFYFFNILNCLAKKCGSALGEWGGISRLSCMEQNKLGTKIILQHQNFFSQFLLQELTPLLTPLTWKNTVPALGQCHSRMRVENRGQGMEMCECSKGGRLTALISRLALKSRATKEGKKKNVLLSSVIRKTNKEYAKELF